MQDVALKPTETTIAVLNIERKAPIVMGGALAPSTAPQVTDVNPNRWGEPVSRPKGAPVLQGGEEVSSQNQLLCSTFS